jgi:hypothetical protein
VSKPTAGPLSAVLVVAEVHATFEQWATRRRVFVESL